MSLMPDDWVALVIIQ